MVSFDIIHHFMVPQHLILPKEQEDELLTKHNLTKDSLPKIKSNDPAIVHLKPKMGDVIWIKRKSPNFDELFYYRVVV